MTVLTDVRVDQLLVLVFWVLDLVEDEKVEDKTLEATGVVASGAADVVTRESDKVAVLLTTAVEIVRLVPASVPGVAVAVEVGVEETASVELATVETIGLVPISILDVDVEVMTGETSFVELVTVAETRGFVEVRSIGAFVTVGSKDVEFDMPIATGTPISPEAAELGAAVYNGPRISVYVTASVISVVGNGPRISVYATAPVISVVGNGSGTSVIITALATYAPTPPPATKTTVVGNGPRISATSLAIPVPMPTETAPIPPTTEATTPGTTAATTALFGGGATETTASSGGPSTTAAISGNPPTSTTVDAIPRCRR